MTITKLSINTKDDCTMTMIRLKYHSKDEKISIGNELTQYDIIFETYGLTDKGYVLIKSDVDEKIVTLLKLKYHVIQFDDRRLPQI